MMKPVDVQNVTLSLAVVSVPIIVKTDNSAQMEAAKLILIILQCFIFKNLQLHTK